MKITIIGSISSHATHCSFSETEKNPYGRDHKDIWLDVQGCSMDPIADQVRHILQDKLGLESFKDLWCKIEIETKEGEIVVGAH